MDLITNNIIKVLLINVLIALTGCTGTDNIAKAKNTSTSQDDFFSIDSVVKYGLNLQLKDSAFLKIKTKREDALEKELLIKSKKDYVKGKLVCNGHKLKVKARLKGDHIDHLKGRFWSFRIKANDKDKSIIGHEKVSIQGVQTRAFIKEWVFHKLLNREHIIGLQYDFLNFCVNDTLCGTYAIESHFDNHLLKLANRPEGPILKIDEDGFWEQTYNKALRNQDSIMQNAKIEVYNDKWAEKNIEITQKAIKMLDDYRNGRKSAEEVLDLKIWARFIAVSELMGSPHNLRWHNLRFYYNPTTNKIEPIGFDNGTWLESKNVYFLNDPETFYKYMFKNSEFKQLTIKEAKRIASAEYMEDFFEKYNHKIKFYQKLIRKDYPKYTFWREHFKKSQARMNLELDTIK